MKDLMKRLDILISRYPVLEESRQDIEKAYLVLAVDNAGDLGFAGIAYLEERNDLK